ncbi:MAG TPA: mechanosensitive ion channel [Candidatus Desulfobacillus sp.]|nr:mechanosensitive ion channel [Candidatus Desulfobacillus sp.]
MEKTQFGGLIADLWRDLQRPDVLWQAAVLALCLALAWLVSYLLRRRADPRLPVHPGRRGLQRLAFPLSALLLVLIARPLLQPWQPVSLLRLAVPLLAAFALIRAVLFALRQGFPRAAWLSAFERLLTLLILAGVAIHIGGLAPEIIEALEEIQFTIGKQRLSLWLILQGAATVLVTLLVALWLGSLAEQRLMAASGLDGNLKLVFARLARALLILLAVLISLPLVGIDLTALSIFGGALGVGIGLGLQRIAANYVSGFILLLDRSIRLGNVVTVDEYAGEVTHITTRYTVLRSSDGAEAIVPNELMVSSVVMNQTYTNTRVRHAVRVQVGYGCDVERAMALLVEAARAQAGVLAEPEPKAFLVGFADSGIDLELGFWIEAPKGGALGIKSAINLAIWRAFGREGIEIPFPQREVRLLEPRDGQ